MPEETHSIIDITTGIAKTFPVNDTKSSSKGPKQPNTSLHQSRHDLQVYGIIKLITSITELTRDGLAGELNTVS